MTLFSGKRLQARDLNRIQKKLSPALAPLGKLYGFLMDRRARKYARLKPYRAGIPCISVGNIALGGTGKTPLTDWLLCWAEKHGKRAVVLTRGYGARPPCYPYTVSSRSVAAQAGDEPLMLALAHPSARVVVDPVRCRGAVFAEHEHHPDFFVMDDGFQHLALHRDVDIVLLRPEDFTENWDKVVPAGMWREGAKALNRASVFLVRAEEAAFDEHARLIRDRLKDCAAPIFSFALRASGLEPVLGKKAQCPRSSSAALPGAPSCSTSACANFRFMETPNSGRTREDHETTNMPYLLVSGVGSPQDVRETATRFMGRAPDEHCIFADHHAYSEQDAARIGCLAKARNLVVVTTSKDAPKLSMVADFVFYSIVVKVRFGRKALVRSVQGNGRDCVEWSFDEWWMQTARTLGLARAEHDAAGASPHDGIYQGREK